MENNNIFDTPEVNSIENEFTTGNEVTQFDVNEEMNWEESTPQPSGGSYSIEELEALGRGEILPTKEEFGGDPTPEGNSVPVSMLDPSLAVELLDAVVIAGGAFLLRRFGKEFKKADLKATPSEKKQLEPLFQKCLESVNMNFTNPWSALVVSIGIIYGSKILLHYDNVPDVATSEYIPESEHLSESVLTSRPNQTPKRGRGRPRKNDSPLLIIE
jgi:hypothetical protein